MKKYQIRYGLRGQMPMYVETLTEDKLDQFMERKDVLILSVFEIEESKWFEMAVSKTLSR